MGPTEATPQRNVESPGPAVSRIDPIQGSSHPVSPQSFSEKGGEEWNFEASSIFMDSPKVVLCGLFDSLHVVEACSGRSVEIPIGHCSDAVCAVSHSESLIAVAETNDLSYAFWSTMLKTSYRLEIVSCLTGETWQVDTRFLNTRSQLVVADEDLDLVLYADRTEPWENMKGNALLFNWRTRRVATDLYFRSSVNAIACCRNSRSFLLCGLDRSTVGHPEILCEYRISDLLADRMTPRQKYPISDFSNADARVINDIAMDSECVYVGSDLGLVVFDRKSVTHVSTVSLSAPPASIFCVDRRDQNLVVVGLASGDIALCDVRMMGREGMQSIFETIRVGGMPVIKIAELGGGEFVSLCQNGEVSKFRPIDGKSSMLYRSEVEKRFYCLSVVGDLDEGIGEKEIGSKFDMMLDQQVTFIVRVGIKTLRFPCCWGVLRRVF